MSASHVKQEVACVTVGPRSDQERTWRTLPMYYNNRFMEYTILHATSVDLLMRKGIILSKEHLVRRGDVSLERVEARTRCDTKPRDPGRAEQTKSKLLFVRVLEQCRKIKL
jgi:hypothetical protein